LSLTIVVVIAATLVALALVTQAGVFVLNRMHPAAGKIIDVAGARIHVVDIGPRDGNVPPVVMIHGASSNLETMRLPVGDMLAKSHRVVLIDRPGHGWSIRDRLSDSTPRVQARMIEEALGKLGVTGAVLVVHSWAGSLGSLMALNYPERIAGLVMLAPVAYPWPGGVGTYNKLVALPVIGPLLAYTITLPLGLALVRSVTRGAFLPQVMPLDYVRAAAISLVLRPREFLANARDLVTLKAAVAEQAPRYAAINVSTVVIHGDADETVSLDIHSRPFATAAPDTKLIVLAGAGHMVQNATPDLVVREIEQMTALLQRLAGRSDSTKWDQPLESFRF
jgi:pimeloyl-ACP methyl ester carboxylesterase